MIHRGDHSGRKHARNGAGIEFRNRRARWWVAGASVFALLIMGASPALASTTDGSADTAVVDGAVEGAETGVAATPPVAEPAPAPAPAPVPVPEPAPAPAADQAPAVEQTPAPGTEVAAADDPQTQQPSTPAPADTVQPSFLYWTVVDQAGAAVFPTSFAIESDGRTATVKDNTGEADYVGLDLDPIAGTYKVSELVDDLDPDFTYQLVTGETLKVRPSTAPEGTAVGDDAEWTELTVVDLAATEQIDVPPPTVTLTPVPVVQAQQSLASDQAPVAAPLAVESHPSSGLYHSTKDASPTTSWYSSGSPPPQIRIDNFTSAATQNASGQWALGATWQREGTGGAKGWTLEYSVAPERWGSASGPTEVPQPNRTLGGVVLFVDNSAGFPTSYCKYSNTSDSANTYQGLTCQTINSVVTASADGLTLTLNWALPAELSGQAGCPSKLGSTGYLRSWTGSNDVGVRNVQAWARPVTITPPSSCGETTINIKKIGDRTGPGLTDGAPVEGATYTAYASAGTGTGAPNTSVILGTCVTLADGTCSITIINAVAPNDVAWIVETGTPAGWVPIASVGTGSYSSAKTETKYQFKVSLATGSANRTIAVPSTSQYVTYPNSSISGAWVNARVNPEFPEACGVSIAMIFDTSSSISQAEMSSFKSAAKLFVGDSGLGGTPSAVTMMRFDTTALTMNGGSSYSLAVEGSAGSNSGWKGAMNQIDQGLPNAGNSNGYTNWDAALRLVKASGSYDMVVFLTDGDPTAYGLSGNDQNTTVQIRMVEQAVLSANAVKAMVGPKGGNTKIVGVGVGLSTNSDLSFRTITGPTLGSDYFLAGDFDVLQGTLHDLALKNCGGTISVVKKLLDEEGNVTSTSAAGWQFSATGDVVNGTPAQSTTTTSGTNFALTFGDTANHNVVIAETPQADYTFQGATCTNANGAVTVAASTSSFTVPVKQGLITSCIVTNKAVPKIATMAVTKEWMVKDGFGNTIYDSKNPGTHTLPTGISATLAIANSDDTMPAGTPAVWGTVVGGLAAGQVYKVGETEALQDVPGCVGTSSEMTKANGVTTSTPIVPGGVPVTLVAGANTYELTNTVECESSIVVLKEVLGGGSGVPSNWDLTVTNDSNPSDVTTVAGSSTVATDNTVEVAPANSYKLSEALAAGAGTNLAYLFKDLERCTAMSGTTCTTWTTVNVNTAIQVPVGQQQVYRFVNELAPTVQVPFTGGVASELYAGIGLSVAVLAILLGSAVWTRRTRGQAARR